MNATELLELWQPVYERDPSLMPVSLAMHGVRMAWYESRDAESIINWTAMEWLARNAVKVTLYGSDGFMVDVVLEEEGPHSSGKLGVDDTPTEALNAACRAMRERG